MSDAASADRISFGLTLALAHTGFVYYLFRGKVVLEEGGHY